MAQHTTIVLLDDLDNNVTDDVETITFAYGNDAYEIDLGSDNRDALDVALAPYLAAARKVRRGAATTTRRRAGSASARGEATAIRAWAAANGVEVSARGRIPAPVREQYEAAQA